MPINKHQAQKTCPTKMFTINFDWSWIKDKQIEIDGDEWVGLIFISDEEDNIIAIYRYEKVPIKQ